MEPSGQPPQSPERPKDRPTAETTWLEGVAEFEHRDLPDGGTILLFTLINGHRYAVALNGKLLQLVRLAVSSVAVVGAESMPPSASDGHGA